MDYMQKIGANLKSILKLSKNRDQSAEHDLFSLRTVKPNHTDNIKYVNLGPLLGKKYFNLFLKAVEKEMGFKIDGGVYSRVCVEVSKVDDYWYIEISLNELCRLPIAGYQLPILIRHATNNDMGLVGYVDSLNFILNDTRNF
jgi:hypothetical protein